jgi:hypothetical protein
VHHLARKLVFLCCWWLLHRWLIACSVGGDLCASYLTEFPVAVAACFFTDVVLLLLFEFRRMALLLHCLWVTHFTPKPAQGVLSSADQGETKS